MEGDDYWHAVREHLATQFAGQGGAAEIVVTADRVIIRWKESSEAESLAEQGGNLAEKAELGRNRITQAKFRMAGGELRPDVLTYCGEALRMFETMPKDEVRKITLEIAMLGAKGLSVNDPSAKYQLRSLPGDFSGLHLLCIEYVGFKIIDSSIDIGFDISAEYAEARRLYGNTQ